MVSGEVVFRFITLGGFLLIWSVSSQSMEPVGYSGTWASAAYFNNAIDVISETSVHDKNAQSLKGRGLGDK